MKTYSYIFAGFITLLVLGALGYILFCPKAAVAPVAVSEVASSSPVEITTPTPEEIPIIREENPQPIWVTTPLPDAKITSPLLITGKARGTWYFEASFPIQLVDNNGNVIAQTHAQATEDWMTENFVPFTATLTWASTSTNATNGMLIFRKDNPSGLPEHDAEMDVPVSF